MYRSNGEEAVSYTAEDLLLYKESPFASWMERLTLENPLHGIAPDELGDPLVHYNLPAELTESEQCAISDSSVESVKWGDLVQHKTHLAIHSTVQPPRLRHGLGGIVDVGDDVYVVKKIDDVRRHKETWKAMQSGVSIIVNAHLCVGKLSSDVDLLVRTNGVSELGNYLYIPCDSSDYKDPHSALALCCAADLLHSMQGALPPQLLVIRGEFEPICLSTEDHIYHYRAVKKSFMTAQASFRSHAMPKPEDSSSFGRWKSCANEVMKRRSKLVNEDNIAIRIHDAPSAKVHSVEKLEAVDSYVDSDWPGNRRKTTKQHIFNDRLMTSNGSDF
ncbi:MAG: hypothetical protein AB8B81_01705 [Halioglobus sp.]